MTYDSFCEKLRQYYDGYHFTHNSIGMYNPFSLLNAFKRKEFGSYWFETGTPTYLVELLKDIITIWNGWHTKRPMPKC